MDWGGGRSLLEGTVPEMFGVWKRSEEENSVPVYFFAVLKVHQFDVCSNIREILAVLECRNGSFSVGSCIN